MVSPLHTPGVYTTPVAFISAFVFDWDLIVVVQTVKNKASMTLFNMSLSHPFAQSAGMDDAKIINPFYTSKLFSEKVHFAT